MILSKIENVKPEQKLNSEQTADGTSVRPDIGNTNVIGSRNSEARTAIEVIKELETHADTFTCPKSLLPEVFSIMDREYTDGDFKYMIFGQTAHCKRTKKLIKRKTILKLSLYREAFEVMVTGEKRIEFRKDKPWIRSRLIDSETGERKMYDYIHFTNGYGSNKPYFICKYEGFGYEYGLFTYSNGLEVDANNLIGIKCGEIVEVGNWS